MAKSKVLKRFPYAANGFTVRYVNVGDEIDFGAATDSLADEGLIETKKKK